MDKLNLLLTRGVAEILPSKENLEKLMQSKKIRVYLGVDPKNNTRFVFNEKRIKYTLITGAQANEYQMYFLLLVHDLPVEIKQDASESLAASLGRGIPIFCLKDIFKNPPHIIKTMAADQKEMLLRSFSTDVII